MAKRIITIFWAMGILGASNLDLFPTFILSASRGLLMTQLIGPVILEKTLLQTMKVWISHRKAF
jgi:hypothetical protein